MLGNGFVLLTNDAFNHEQLIDDLQTDWQITATNAEHVKSSFTFSVGDALCALSVMPAPIPNNEAEHHAQANYYCADALDIAKAHHAHLIVTVMNLGKGNAIETMKLYSKIIACCLGQSNATGVYTSDTVFSADFYRKACELFLHGDDIPFMIWVFVGLVQNENGNQLYTMGMEKFGKEEMEINNSSTDMQTLHNTLSSMCSYIISADLVLQDGETIGFSAEQKLAITRSKSVYAASEFSLKIAL